MHYFAIKRYQNQNVKLFQAHYFSCDKRQTVTVKMTANRPIIFLIFFLNQSVANSRFCICCVMYDDKKLDKYDEIVF